MEQEITQRREEGELWMTYRGQRRLAGQAIAEEIRRLTRSCSPRWTSDCNSAIRPSLASSHTFVKGTSASSASLHDDEDDGRPSPSAYLGMDELGPAGACGTRPFGWRGATKVGVRLKEDGRILARVSSWALRTGRRGQGKAEGQ